MDTKQLLNKLNFFYSLEVIQVELYRTQYKNVKDIYIKKVLERIAVIEEQHVKNIATKIKELGGKPIFISDILAPIAGKITGEVTSLTGLINLLKINIKLEEKAMKDYKKFILQAGKDEDLFNLLWSNLIDEDLHAAWFTNKIKQLEKNFKKV